MQYLPEIARQGASATCSVTDRRHSLGTAKSQLEIPRAAGGGAGFGGRMFNRIVIALALAIFGAGAQGAGAEPALGQNSVVASPGGESCLGSAREPRSKPERQGGDHRRQRGGTGTYASQAYRGGGYQGAAAAGAWGVGTTFGCMALSPIVAGALVNANEHRQLTSREVHVMLADCTIPFVGGWLMGRYWDSPRGPATRRPPRAARECERAGEALTPYGSLMGGALTRRKHVRRGERTMIVEKRVRPTEPAQPPAE